MVVATPACGGDDDFESTPLDVSGAYTVSVTNKTNGCALLNWKEGEQTTGIPLTVLQDGKNISGTIDGLVGSAVAFWIGSASFQGTVDGNVVHAENFGTKAFNENACTYTINMVMDATLDGNALQGAIHYTPKTNDSPDCGVLANCTSLQEFSGSRPPK